MSGARKFVIWAPSFSEDNGGAISLHYLCHRLNEAGETALLWPGDRPFPTPTGNPRRLLGALRYAAEGRKRRFSTGPFPNRLASRRDLRDAIIVYPEIVTGNPLGSQRVVRWLLHKPGHFGGRPDYGADDYYFFMTGVYNDATVNAPPENRLNLIWLNDCYRDEGNSSRNGSCYLLRKGAGRPLVHDTTDSLQLDGLSHDEIAKEFNRRRLFYSYDPYTTYYFYAALCGCIPVIVPEPGKSKVDWMPREDDRYGLAYGEQEIGWAVETRDKLLARFQRQRDDENIMIARFIRRCRERYGK